MQKELLYLSGLDDTARNLIRIYSKDFVCPETLREWFFSVDFEALLPQISCMAAAAGTITRFAGVPEQFIPRLRGIIKYVHTLNSGMVSGVCALGAKMNEANIPILLMEDTALYMRNSTAPQRHLWQTFVGVPKQNFKQAVSIAREVGFSVEEYPFAAVARQGVMRQILITSVEEKSPIWQGATEHKKGNVVFLCPDAASIFFDISKRVFRGLTKPNPRAVIACWIMDMRILLEQMQKEDWLKAARLAADDNVGSHIYLLLSVYSAETGISIKYKELFANEQIGNRLAKILYQYAQSQKKNCRVWRLILRCRIRRPDSLLHTVRLCIKEALMILGNKLIDQN